MMEHETIIALGSWDGWRLSGDAKGWHVEELRGQRPGAWVSRLYLPDVAAALGCAYDRAVRESGASSGDVRQLAQVIDRASAQVCADVRAVPEWALPRISPGDALIISPDSWHGWRLACDRDGWRVEELRGVRYAPRLYLPSTAAALLYAYDRAMRGAGRPVSDVRGLARLVDGVTLDVFQAFPGNRRKVSTLPRPLADLADWASWRAPHGVE